jgi:oxygen-independent coproporphyrinogen III oxidase
MSDIRFDSELIRRYDVNVPPYVSYPAPPHFHTHFDVLAYRRAALLSNAGLQAFAAEVRLPSHLNSEQTACYLERLNREIELQAELFDPRRQITHLSIRGDVNGFAGAAALQQLLGQLGRHLQLAPQGECELCIDIDPGTATSELIREFAALGFTRANVSIPPAQSPTARATQSMRRVHQLIDEARNCGFASLGFDLVYGLPLQTAQDLSKLLDLALAVKPDRLTTYLYPHLPASHQIMVRTRHRASAATRLSLRQLAIETLTQAGYIDLGMDRFASPDCVADAPADGDLLGLGAGAVSRMGSAYAQNAKCPAAYCAALQRHALPIECGVELTIDDRVRREVIQQIMCRRELDFGAIGNRYALDFHSYFARELRQLRTLADDGLVIGSDTGFAVSPRGHLLVQNITTVFDAYNSAPARLT